MKKFTIAVIGLGGRGYDLIKSVFTNMDNITVSALCDVYEDRCKAAAELVNEKNGNTPNFYLDYKELFEKEKPDCVYIATSWQTHFEIAIHAMKCGVAVACEVSPGFAMDECWDLVKTWEKTRTPFMFMENCCYGREELMVMNMIEKGVFGEVIHCDGAYAHDLRLEVGYGVKNRHYRLDNYKKRNCENYPTHELGPIAQIMGVNRGNRILTVASFASKAAGMNEFAKNNPDTELCGVSFNQGDIITTVLRLANGETIRLTLDTTLPRAYSRGFTVHGTKALFTEDNGSLFIDGVHNKYDFCWKEQWGNIEEYREEYEHPIWKKFLDEGVQGGHGGMDWLQFEDFFAHLDKGEPMPINVYDMAVWTAVSILSEESIALGGQPLPMPDFTRGSWF